MVSCTKKKNKKKNLDRLTGPSHGEFFFLGRRYTFRDTVNTLRHPWKQKQKKNTRIYKLFGFKKKKINGLTCFKNFFRFCVPVKFFDSDSPPPRQKKIFRSEKIIYLILNLFARFFSCHDDSPY